MNDELVEFLIEETTRPAIDRLGERIREALSRLPAPVRELVIAELGDEFGGDYIAVMHAELSASMCDVVLDLFAGAAELEA